MNLRQALVSILGGLIIVLAGALSVNDTLFDQQSQSLAAEASAIFKPLKNARSERLQTPLQAQRPVRQSVGFTLPLQAGWNIIGTAGADAALDDLKGCDFQTPAFGYNGASYEKTDRLALGRGYWVYVSNDCRLQFPPAVQPMPMMEQGEAMPDNSTAAPADAVAPAAN